MDPNGHRGRLRERFFNAGLEAFAPHEMLELLLTFAIPRRDTKPIAYALINKFGSLHAVLQAPPQELMTIEGIGENAATLISMIMPLFRAYHQSQQKETPVIKNLEQCVHYCKGLFAGEQYEKMYVVCLDAHMRIVNTVLISSGDVTEVRVYTRHVMNAVSRSNATGIVITHNHPSGSAMPSNEDVLLTDSISKLMHSIDVKLYDHVIVAPLNTYSFRQSGWLSAAEELMEDAAQHPERLIPIPGHRGGKKGDMRCTEEFEESWE